MLFFPSGSKERPTTDFLREALFNLTGSLNEKTFLDLFAGSGSVGLEAASRGARRVILVESNKKLAGVIRKNIPNGFQDGRLTVMAVDVALALRDLFKKQCLLDIIFADPPYHRGLVAMTLDLLGKYPVLAKGGILVMQHSVKETIPETASGIFCRTDQRKYGENALTFLKWRENNAERFYKKDSDIPGVL